MIQTTTERSVSGAKELTGKRIRHVPVSDAEALQAFRDAGLPEGFPGAALGFDIWAREGYHAIAAPAVEELTGRPPETLRSFLERHIDTLLGGRATVDL